MNTRWTAFTTAVLGVVLGMPAGAQDGNGLFADDDSLVAFVEQHGKVRDFPTLLRELGGGDEYTDQQIAGLDAQLRNIYPDDFTAFALVKSRTLESGFRQRVYTFWNGTAYVWLYLMTHQRQDGVQVIQFSFNSDNEAIIPMGF